MGVTIVINLITIMTAIYWVSEEFFTFLRVDSPSCGRRASPSLLGVRCAHAKRLINVLVVHDSSTYR